MKPPRLLIIDDEPDIGEFIRDVAQDVGFDASAIHRPDLFSETYSDDVDLIVLDLVMPRIDGIELIRFLASHSCRASLILISGFDTGVLNSAQKLASAHGLHVIGTLTKPIRYDDLAALLRNRPSSGSKPKATTPEQLSQEELHEAFALRQLVNHYQPQLDLQTGNLVGVEALVRWQHPEHGLLSPNTFIPLVEEAGLTGVLTLAVLEQALQQCGEWSQAGLDIQLSVNMSADTISNLALPEKIMAMAKVQGVRPSQITMEVTEQALMHELIKSLDILTRLRMKGIKLSIDDFGTGYSSLLQLHRAPFSELKIDRSFVSQMDSDQEAHVIVETSIMLGHKLGMKVVAEGVENRAQWDLLADAGCDWSQGFLMARPMPGEQILDWAQDRA